MIALLVGSLADTIAASPCSFGDAARAILLWFIAAFLHHFALAALLLVSDGDVIGDDDDDDDDELLHSRRRKLQHRTCLVLSSFSEACCPRRRARFYKCAAASAARRRCHASCRQQQQQQEQEPVNQDLEEIQEPPQHKKCCLSLESAAFFAKLHLPPPLPWRKRSRRHQSSASSYLAEDSAYENTTEHSGDTNVHQEEEEGSSKMKVKEEAIDSVCNKDDADQHFKQPEQILAMPIMKSSRKSRRTTSTTALIDLARMQHWDTILQQCAVGSIRKRDIRHRDADGLNTLHWVCAGSPPEKVVQVLLRISPSVAHKTDNEGSTALHFATHYSASLAVVKTLLKAHPQAIRAQDRHGRSPLYHAVEKRAGIDVLQALIQADPSMVTVPCLPLHIRQELPKTHIIPVVTRPVAARTPLFLMWSQVVLDRKARQSKRGRQWEKAQLLLEAAAHCYYTNNGTTPIRSYKYRFLSAAIAMDIYLPDQIVSLAIESHPHQLSIPDEVTGQLPLAQAAGSRQYCMKRSHNMLKELLDAYPSAAAVCDSLGRTPLLLAAQAGKPWSLTRGGTLDGGILERLFDANPDALLQSAAVVAAAAMASTGDNMMMTDTKGFDSNIDPFGLITAKHHEWIQRRQMSLALTADEDEEMNATSHTGGGVSDVEQLETIFQLIRANPSIIMKSS